MKERAWKEVDVTLIKMLSPKDSVVATVLACGIFRMKHESY
jgi:hypothetical protein